MTKEELELRAALIQAQINAVKAQEERYLCNRQLDEALELYGKLSLKLQALAQAVNDAEKARDEAEKRVQDTGKTLEDLDAQWSMFNKRRLPSEPTE